MSISFPEDRYTSYPDLVADGGVEREKERERDMIRSHSLYEVAIR